MNLAMSRWLWCSTLVVGLDQLTKALVQRWLLPLQPIRVAPSLNLTLMYNKGAAFSFLAGADGWQRWFFVVLAAVIGTALLLWLLRLPADRSRQALALALLLGGALGNLIDRVLYGRVVDFIQVYYHGWYWPTFNIADSAISIGAVLLVIDALLGPPRHASSTATGSSHD